MSERKKGKKKKKRIKGMQGGIEVEVGELEGYKAKGLPSSMTQNADIWWGVFKSLKGDRKLDFLNATLETEIKDEFWEGVRLFDAVEDVFNDLVTRGKLKEGIRLLERFRERKPDLYKETYPYCDYKLVYYYASCNDHGKIKEATRYFREDPERNADYLFKVLDALRLYGLGEETYQLSREAYKKLKNSEEIIPPGIAELQEMALFSTISRYITSPNYKEKGAEEEFRRDLEELDYWDKHPHTLDDEHLQKTMKALRGEIRSDWKREDFLTTSGSNYEDNIYLLCMDFIRYLHIKKSFEWVTSDLLCDIAFGYFGGVPRRKDRFYFTFSAKYLDTYLSEFFGFFSVLDARGMAVPKALEYFSAFLHERGILSDAELRKIEKGIEASKEKLRWVYERDSWKYRFLENWE